MRSLWCDKVRRKAVVRNVGPVKPAYATKDMLAYKRAADEYVRKATRSEKTARQTMVALGIHDAKGNLTKDYT